MRGPYGFELTENCETCELRSNGFFCQMPQVATKDFNAVKSSSSYRKARSCFSKSRLPGESFCSAKGR